MMDIMSRLVRFRVASVNIGGMNTSDLPSVTVADLPEQSDAVQLLDVRENDEWAAGHAPGAVHIPLGELPARVGELNHEGEVYVVCRSGGRSARATAWLVQNGVDAFNVEGGMKQYEASGRRMESDSGQPTVL